MAKALKNKVFIFTAKKFELLILDVFKRILVHQLYKIPTKNCELYFRSVATSNAVSYNQSQTL